jgi:mRNA-degrading endonuclease YafQ of YafQ-DinJ toxin-antitoxin module
MPIKVRTCPLFKKTVKAYRTNKTVIDKLAEFVKAKSNDPQSIFGGKDRAFTRKGHLSGFWHAGLSHDISIVYKISDVGGEKVLDLYGSFSHDELGTGQPANMNRQMSAAAKLNNQELQ